ncbi:eIF-2-alpha kinase activator GCN1 isoform X1 [Tachysurus ichikawai]
MAADTQQVSDTMKKFAMKVTTSSVKERKDILGELKECINGKSLPEPAIKGLCKLFCLTLHRYRDAASRRDVLSVIELLAQTQPHAIGAHLPINLLTCGIVSKGIMPGRSTASASCSALPWICLIVRVVFHMPENREAPHWEKMVEVHSLLLAEVMGGASKNAIKSVTKQLNKLWKDIPALVDQYMSTLLSLNQNPSSMPMLAVCVDFCTSQKDMATINKHKSAILDLYLKTVLMSKTRPLQHIMVKSGSLLQHVSHSEFKEQLLPTLQKSLLRSPENSIQTISSLLASLTLDLSQYALDIGKGLASQLKASNIELMEHAVQAMQNLAQQCSDPNAIQDLVTHLFSILGGSEGKITVVAQKINVLSGIKSCSCHAVSGPSSQSLSSNVLLQFIPLLQQEVHEGTLVHAVSVMSQWTARLNVEVPAALKDWLKKAFTLKSSTSAVRHAYLQVMLRAFKGDTLNQALDFVPLLIQIVEKAAPQSSQLALSEAVAASLLLCHLSMLDSIPESKLTSFWNLILDEKKALFTTEKFLGQTSEEALCTVLKLCERLFLDHPQRLNNIKAQMYHRAIVAVLLCRVYRVRKHAHQCVKKLFSSLGGCSLAHGLLRELGVVISKHKVLPPEALQTETGELTELGRLYTPPRILLEALRALCSAAGQWNNSSEADKLALDIILVAHHPSIVAEKSEPWPLLLSSMKIDATVFIDQHLQTILYMLMEGNADNQAVRNAIGELSVLSPGKLLYCVMDSVIQRLSNPALKQVSPQEYAIMNTPEGELYDKSIIMSAQQESTKKGNMKRENKAYSFKEQIIELELKEEIKKKKGIKDEVQLTSKQREMMQNQLEKESSIRKKLREVLRDNICIS